MDSTEALANRIPKESSIEEELSIRHFAATAESDKKREVEQVWLPFLKKCRQKERKKRAQSVKCKRKKQKAARRLHRSK